jgi:hypothetical protein
VAKLRRRTCMLTRLPIAARREAGTSAGIIDRQSIKAPAPGAERDYDAAKKFVRRKHHIAVDADGRLLLVNLTPADIPDSTAA